MRAWGWVRRVAAALLALGFAAVAGVTVWLVVIWSSLPSVDGVPRAGAVAPTPFMRASECADVAREYRALDRISPVVACAVVRAEDRHFFQHDGVDWPAVSAAVEDGLRRGEMRWGGSTIPMQLARNLFLSAERSAGRKARELSLAPRLVERLGRRRVLELYLNVAEWAPCRYGVEEAARWWFGHGSERMDVFEATLLAALLPRPARPLVPDDAIVIARKQGLVVRQFGYGGLMSRERMDQELTELDRTWRALVKAPDAEALRAALHERSRTTQIAPLREPGAGWLEAECGWAP